MTDTRALSVSLDDLVFQTTYGAPAAGQWLAEVSDLVGWWEPPRDGTDTTPHWSGHGQVAGPPRLEARTLSLEGSLFGSALDGIGSVHAGAEALRRRRKGTLRVAELDFVREADVRVTAVQATRVSPWETLVTLTMVADDPLLYSSEAHRMTNGSLALPNRGDAWAAGRLLLVGPHNAISIAHTGGVFSFPAVAGGQTRLIDFREQAVWAGNARVFGSGSGAWPRVAPGGSTWVVAGVGAGAAVLTRTEAWV